MIRSISLTQAFSRAGRDSARTLYQLGTLDFVRVVDLVGREIPRRVEAGKLPEMGQLELGHSAG